ncbi:hypothetical protein QQF21_21630 [Lelliottia sp. V89_10]|uniref:hypothetical protein n=1 Tax=Lelliottia wanjuensis TaxID=3050585 RepID=UPI00249EDD80|nr:MULTISPECIES: hypothetical protein [unclassified Lelliottia]MDI3360565.1 hypothetical protein [Lelliottia sp. V89_13]MDK9551015.1 hypothetical protein [Lelliottia sp. V89_5]MDK9598226.1 hypothetical protein [Lelliottia sp. V89_10]
MDNVTGNYRHNRFVYLIFCGLERKTHDLALVNLAVAVDIIKQGVTNALTVFSYLKKELPGVLGGRIK